MNKTETKKSKKYYAKNIDCNTTTIKKGGPIIVSEKRPPLKFKFEGDDCPYNLFPTIHEENLKVGEVYNLVIGDSIRIRNITLISKSIQGGPQELMERVDNYSFWTFIYGDDQRIWVDCRYAVRAHYLEK